MITVKPLREEALKAGYRAMLERIPALDFATFCAKLADWDVMAFCRGEQAVGMLMTRGNELHVAVLPEVRGKWLSRRLIREVIGPLVRKHGEAKTSVVPGNSNGADFVSRLGFKYDIQRDIAVLRAGFSNLVFDPSSILGPVIGSVAGGLLQGDAASNAGSQAASAANNAAATQLQMFNTTNQQQLPYRQAGYTGLDAILRGLGYPATGSGLQSGGRNIGGVGAGGAAPTVAQFTSAGSPATATVEGGEGGATVPGQPAQAGGFDQAGYQAALDAWNAANGLTPGGAGGAPGAASDGSGIAPGYFSHQFNAADLNSNLAPNYAFQLQQGLGAAKNAANLQTGLLSGNTLKGINDYAQNFAGNAYQQAFNNYTSQQTNIFNRLSNIAGLGQTANQATGQAGVQAAGNAGQALIAGGAAQAAGTVGQANALSGGLNNATGWYQLSNMLNGGGGSGFGGFGGGVPTTQSYANLGGVDSGLGFSS